MLGPEPSKLTQIIEHWFGDLRLFGSYPNWAPELLVKLGDRPRVPLDRPEVGTVPLYYLSYAALLNSKPKTLYKPTPMVRGGRSGPRAANSGYVGEVEAELKV